MIQIADAGKGKLVGGVVAGVYRVETQEFASQVIAPRFFQGEAFTERVYLDEAISAVRCSFRLLQVGRNEQIEVSTSYILAGVRRRLSETQYDWRQVEEGQEEIQERVERAFWFHLRNIGFRVDYDEYVDPDRQGLVWWRQVVWLKGGDARAMSPNPDRAKVCKTGWSTYSIWANNTYKQAKELVKKKRGTKTEKRKESNE